MEIGLGFWLRWEKEYKFALVNSKVLRMKQLIFIGTMAMPHHNIMINLMVGKQRVEKFLIIRSLQQQIKHYLSEQE